MALEAIRNNNRYPCSPPHTHTCDSDLCGICKKLVETSDKDMQCDKCNRWIHIKCNKTSIKPYEQFKQTQKIFSVVCDKMVAKNHRAIECNTCFKWIHLKCNKKWEKIQAISREYQHVILLHKMHDRPLLTLDDKQFELTANGISQTDLNHIFLSQTQLEMLGRFNAPINNITFDLNEENNGISIPPANCKYYTIEEVQSPVNCTYYTIEEVQSPVNCKYYTIEEVQSPVNCTYYTIETFNTTCQL